MKKRNALAVICMIMAVSLSACGDATTLNNNGATLTSIAVTPQNPSIAADATQQFTAIGTYSDNSTENITNSVTWISSDTSKANISNTAFATAVAAGTTTIKAMSGSISDSSILTVTAQTTATLVSIAVTPANPSITIGANQQFTATGTYSDSVTQDITGSVTWSSSDIGKATISNTGLATGVAAGATTINALFGSILSSTTLEVYNSNNEGTITAYYWNSGWVELASWISSTVSRELLIDIDAWNWEPEYSALNVRFDNLLATGNVLPSGTLSDDFNDGIINSLWNSGNSTGATVSESSGVYQINIPAGTTPEGLNQVGWLRTKEYVIQGNFDVQVDFEVNAEYHNTPNANAKLFLTDRNNNGLEISIRNDRYEAREVLASNNIEIASQATTQISGKLRLVRFK